MELGLHHVVLLEQPRGQQTRAVAAHQDLHGLVLHFAAHALDLALGDHVALAQQDHLVGDAIHFVQDVAGDDDVPPCLPHCSNSAIVSARAIGSRPFSGSSSTSTCGSCAIACASLTRCRMPLLYAATCRLRGFRQARPLCSDVHACASRTRRALEAVHAAGTSR